MYSVLVRWYTSKISNYITCDKDDLFRLLFTLSSDEGVKEFRVFTDNSPSIARDFGWAEFEKWVTEWHYERVQYE